ncbi:MAG: formylglycine-generating enzyme family protein [Saprospiraceae bacterium]|nr:formylglycine-generating enzyme family protein [Saprospiraceae bacterium]
MGDAKGESDECPHEVTVGSFSIGKYEITQADWKAVMGGFPKEPGNPGCDQCPVERVSWNDIQDFLKKASAKYGKRYRLPTEAEWEYAARGGNRSNGHAYSGSNSPGSVAWYDANSGSKTHPVGGKTANELGIHDMSGNVLEWCADLWKAYPGCTASECKDCRVLRGGSWFLEAARLRSADRYSGIPASGGIFSGFRVAQD